MRIIRSIAVAAVVFMLGAGAAVAQDADLERRTVLARELIAVSTGPNLTKAIERHIAAEIDKAAEGEDAEEAAWVRANMPAMIGRMMNRVMADLAPVYAETFTVEELQAQIAFYRSPVGRQIAAKTIDLAVAQETLMQGAMMGFLTEFEAKYCAEFDCEGSGGRAAGKSGR